MDELQHYGVKGMKWGRRKRNPAQEAARKKQFKKVAVTGLAVAGSAAAAVALNRYGGISTSTFQGAAAQATMVAGKKALDDVAVDKFRALAKDMLDDLADANASQDAWMRRQGLGSVVNNRNN